jgi:hypothetical protein
MDTEVSRQFLWTADWPAWTLLGLAVLACAAVLWLYRLERTIVSRPKGLVLTGLRVVVVLALAAMLAKPVLRVIRDHRRQPYVVVLADSSASMRIADTQAPPHERLRLAEMLGVPSARRSCRLDESAAVVAEAAESLAGQADNWSRLSAAGREARKPPAPQDRERTLAAVREVHQGMEAQIASLSQAPPGGVRLDDAERASLLDVKGKLTAIQRRCEQLEADLAPARAAADDLAARVAEALRQAASALAKTAPTLAALGEKVDAAVYAALVEADRSAVDAAGRNTRLQIARAVLTNPGGPGGDSLLKAMAGRYRLKTYSFDSTATAIEASEAGLADTRPASAPAAPLAGSANPAMQTDLTAALRQVQRDLAGQRIAGVIVLSDGRHNAAESPLPVARQFAAQDTPILGVLVGSTRPPTDAAVTAIETPSAVYANDAFDLQAEVKLDGLRGRSVEVRLLTRPVDGGATAATRPAAGRAASAPASSAPGSSGTPADLAASAQTTESDGVWVAADSLVLTPAAEAFRTRVHLKDTPTSAGPKDYRVDVARQEGEVFADNNTYPVTLNVTGDRTQLLLIDGLPRWEYRYLKNLFATRDKTVHLQHVALEPVGVLGQKPLPAGEGHAATTNESAEAFSLPASEQEWLKFDVIVLGDVGPRFLDAATLKVLEKFVGDRGGTLVVVAGPNHMPAAYADTLLADVLGVTFPPGPAGGLAGEYRLALSDEGRRSELLRLAGDDATNDAAWDGLPLFDWRAAIVQAKPSAQVLAYALGRDAPDFMTGKGAAGTQPADALARRQEYIARNAVLATSKYGMGKVMFVGADATWRLRYRRGDEYHHRFWGQVLRWAAAGKLPGGTALVKLGADRASYAPRARPVARAKLTGLDLAPIVSDQVAVKVFRDGRCVHRAPMRYLADSPGMYEAQLPALESGLYHLVLDAPAAEAVLQQEGATEVTADFAVDPLRTGEQIELAADPSLLNELAALSPRGKVVAPPMARQLLAQLPAGEYVTRSVSQQDLWSDWKLLALVLAAAGAEWFIRKSSALP